MIKLRLGIGMLGVALAVHAVEARAEDHRYRLQAAQAAIAEMEDDMNRLRDEAVRSRGAVEAMALCRVLAPTLAAAKRASMDAIDVTRTGLHVLNPANAPDPWERRVLDRFAEQATKGGDLATFDFGEAVDVPGGARMFRYMRAIVADAGCATCHGPAVASEMKARRDELFPKARSVEWREGDLAGAFSVRQPM